MGVLCLAAAGLTVGGLTAGAADDIYTVPDVAVDTTADTAEMARNMAIADGQRAAYFRLLRRLTLPEDYSRFPGLDNSAIEELVASIEIADERASRTRYLADLTIAFDRLQVRELLRTFEIPFSETVKRPVLIVPVFRTADGLLLWEEENEWAAAWRDEVDPFGLVPFVLPLADVRDQSGLDAEGAAAGDGPALRRLAERYGADEIYVFLGDHAETATGNRLSVIAEYFGNGTAADVPRRFSNRNSDDPTEVMRVAVREITQAIEAAWKQQSLLRFGDEAKLAASVSYRSLAEWRQIEDRLLQVAAIQDVRTLAISNREARVVLYYLGDTDQLAVAMAQQNLRLTEKSIYWTIGLAGVGR